MCEKRYLELSNLIFDGIMYLVLWWSGNAQEEMLSQSFPAAGSLVQLHTRRQHCKPRGINTEGKILKSKEGRRGEEEKRRRREEGKKGRGGRQ